MGIRLTKKEATMVFLRQCRARVTASVTLGLLAGCGRAPSFDILGSFFPAWLICMVTGIVLAAIVHWLLGRLKLEKAIQWTIVVYPCMAACFAFLLWLVFFG